MMAAPPRKFIGALFRYGKESAEKRAKLVEWRDAALESIADGNGGDLASGSGNGMNFTKTQSGMTNADWFAALDEAIRWVDAGAMPPATTYGRII